MAHNLHSQKQLVGRPWRARRTTLAGPGGDGYLAGTNGTAKRVFTSSDELGGWTWSAGERPGGGVDGGRPGGDRRRGFGGDGQATLAERDFKKLERPGGPWQGLAKGAWRTNLDSRHSQLAGHPAGTLPGTGTADDRRGPRKNKALSRRLTRRIWTEALVVSVRQLTGCDATGTT